MKKSYSIGIVLKIINLLLITIYSILLIEFGKSCSAPQLCFLIVAIGVMLLFPLLLILRINLKLDRRALKLHIFRAIFNCVGIVTWVIALRQIGANDTTAICYTTPIFTSIIAWYYCKEKFNTYCVAGLVIGMIGVSIVLHPSFNNSMSGTFSALVSSLMWACYDIVCKKQTETENFLRQVFYNFLLTAILLLPLAIFEWREVQIKSLFEIGFVSILSAVNVIILFFAYKSAPITLLMPFSYLRLFFMAIATYLLYDTILSEQAIVGVLIIITSTAIIFWQQHRGKIII